MLTQTSELGVNVMLFIALKGGKEPVSPRAISDTIGGSKSYIAKVCGLLSKAGLVRAVKGSLGGVMLSREAKLITLLEIIEACQGKVLANYCQGTADPKLVCAFHASMKELHDEMTRVLTKWTLEDIRARARPAVDEPITGHCRITKHWTNLDAFLGRTGTGGKEPRLAAKKG
jgi:Rrf2 family protein